MAFFDSTALFRSDTATNIPLTSWAVVLKDSGVAWVGIAVELAVMARLVAV